MTMMMITSSSSNPCPTYVGSDPSMCTYNPQNETGYNEGKKIPSGRNPLTYLQMERCVHQHVQSVLRSNLELEPDRHFRNQNRVNILTMQCQSVRQSNY